MFSAGASAPFPRGGAAALVAAHRVEIEELLQQRVDRVARRRVSLRQRKAEDLPAVDVLQIHGVRLGRAEHLGNRLHHERRERVVDRAEHAAELVAGLRHEPRGEVPREFLRALRAVRLQRADEVLRLGGGSEVVVKRGERHRLPQLAQRLHAAKQVRGSLLHEEFRVPGVAARRPVVRNQVRQLLKRERRLRERIEPMRRRPSRRLLAAANLQKHNVILPPKYPLDRREVVVRVAFVIEP